MGRCAVWTGENVDEWNLVWTRPIRILVHEARRLGLDRYVLPAETAWPNGATARSSRRPPRRRPAGLHVLHWCNEWLSSRQFDKKRPDPRHDLPRTLDGPRTHRRERVSSPQVTSSNGIRHVVTDRNPCYKQAAKPLPDRREESSSARRQPIAAICRWGS